MYDVYTFYDWVDDSSLRQEDFLNSILSSDAASDTLYANRLGADGLSTLSLRGNGGNDVLISNTTSRETRLQGSSNTGTGNTEIDILTGSSLVNDTFMLGACKSGAFRNCYNGSGYAVIRNFGLGDGDCLWLMLDRGYGQSYAGSKKLGYNAQVRQVAGVGSSAFDTAIVFARTNDVIGVIQDRSLTFQQLMESHGLEFMA